MTALMSSGVHSYCTPISQRSESQSTFISTIIRPYSCQWLSGGRFPSCKRRPICWKSNGHLLYVTMGLKLVESYDGSFQLEPQSEQILRILLSSEIFCNQITQQSGLDADSSFEFTGELFQPVPWSAATKHGMPQAKLMLKLESLPRRALLGLERIGLGISSTIVLAIVQRDVPVAIVHLAVSTAVLVAQCSQSMGSLG
eukprot:Gb_00634 [translate_table: standard]